MKKKLPKMALPIGLERKYQTNIRRYVIILKDIINAQVVTALPYIIDEVKAQRPTKDAINLDQTIAEKVASLFVSVRLSMGNQISDFQINQMVQDYAVQLSTWNKAQVFRLIKAGLGIDPYVMEPYLAEELNVFVINNVNLIKTVNAQFIEQTEQIVYDGMRRGLRHEEISKQILGSGKDELGKVSRFKNAKTRANLIGRDQTNKLNGNLTRLRQTNIGVKRYIWRAVGDSRTRDKHAGFNGNEYTWEKGAPGGIHPGDEIQCRCYAESVLDDLIN